MVNKNVRILVNRDSFDAFAAANAAAAASAAAGEKGDVSAGVVVSAAGDVASEDLEAFDEPEK